VAWRWRVGSLLGRPQIVNEGEFVPSKSGLASVLEAALHIFVEVVAWLVAGRVWRRYQCSREAVLRNWEHVAGLVMQFGKGLSLSGDIQILPGGAVTRTW